MTTNFLTCLRLAWRVLRGHAVMYRVKTRGAVTILENCGVAVAECEFWPQETDG